jgi:hypothetical protein
LELHLQLRELQRSMPVAVVVAVHQAVAQAATVEAVLALDIHPAPVKLAQLLSVAVAVAAWASAALLQNPAARVAPES